jgi:hypothetical protein
MAVLLTFRGSVLTFRLDIYSLYTLITTKKAHVRWLAASKTAQVPVPLEIRCSKKARKAAKQEQCFSCMRLCPSSRLT